LCHRLTRGVQVIMMFAQPFWPEGFFDVVCTDSFIPEFWVTPPPAYSHQHERRTKSFWHASQSPASQGDPHPGSSQPAAAQDDETEAWQEHKETLQQGQTLQPQQQQQSWQQPQVQQHDTQQQQQQQQAVYCMVGFVAGSKAEEISKLRQNSVVIRTLSQLDDMFRKSCMRHGIFSCDTAAASSTGVDITGGIACVACASMHI